MQTKSVKIYYYQLAILTMQVLVSNLTKHMQSKVEIIQRTTKEQLKVVRDEESVNMSSRVMVYSVSLTNFITFSVSSSPFSS